VVRADDREAVRASHPLLRALGFAGVACRSVWPTTSPPADRPGPGHLRPGGGPGPPGGVLRSVLMKPGREDAVDGLVPALERLTG
jgi:hypothetical protein